MIDAKEVRNIFEDCLFKDGESHDQYIVIEGITMTIGFHPGRVDQHADDIKNILDNLSDQFKESGGGGYTFLEMPFDKDGNQWGDQPNAQELYILGYAAGWCDYLMPRYMWAAFPGGVPYIVVHNERKVREITKQ